LKKKQDDYFYVIIDNFSSKFYLTVFLKTAGAMEIAKVRSRIKSKPSNQLKVVKLNDTHCKEMPAMLGPLANRGCGHPKETLQKESLKLNTRSFHPPQIPQQMSN